jgi:hypothetical protein
LEATNANNEGGGLRRGGQDRARRKRTTGWLEATHKVAEKKVSRPSAHEQEVERLKAAVEMRDREIEWP